MNPSTIPINITIHDFKFPKLPHVHCDIPLHKKLDEVPLLKGMNCNFVAFFLGNTGSGKTSTLSALLLDKRMFNEVFDKILWVIPRQSRASIEGTKLDNLPKEQIYDELTPENFDKIYETIKEEAENHRRTLLILDDQQANLKGANQRMLNYLVANHRHYGFSCAILCQTYRRCPKDTRMLATHLFTYNLSNGNYNAIQDEIITYDKKRFDAIVIAYKKWIKQHKERKKAFLFFDIKNNKVFIDWNNELSSDLF